MDTLITSLLMVTLAEIGDKTQLLSLFLVMHYKKPWQIIGGIFAATLLNHAASAYAGKLVGEVMPEQVGYAIAAIFIIMGLWLLKADKMDDSKLKKGGNAFLVATAAFFLAEMGDKTQIATFMLAVKYSEEIIAVTIGTTLGMMAANVPVILLGDRFFSKLPLKYARIFAAILFIGFGIFQIISILTADGTPPLA